MFKPGDYCIVRADGAGVYAGEFVSMEGKMVTLAKARKIHYWAGAATLCQLATSGTSKPDECMFPEPVENVTILDVLEIIWCTDEGRRSIEGVKVWKA